MGIFGFSGKSKRKKEEDRAARHEAGQSFDDEISLNSNSGGDPQDDIFSTAVFNEPLVTEDVINNISGDDSNAEETDIFSKSYSDDETEFNFSETLNNFNVDNNPLPDTDEAAEDLELDTIETDGDLESDANDIGEDLFSDSEEAEEEFDVFSSQGEEGQFDTYSYGSLFGDSGADSDDLFETKSFNAVSDLTTDSNETKEEGLSPYAPKAPSPLDDEAEITYIDLDELSSVGKKKEKKHSFGNFFKRHKRAFISVTSIVVVVAVIVSLTLLWYANLDPLEGYERAQVSKGNIIRSITASGSVEPSAKYEITSLTAGQIADSKVEVGDTVKAGDVIYQLDDTEAKLEVERAKINVEKSKVEKNEAESSLSGLKIYANADGTLTDLSISKGSRVNAGSQIGTITRTASDGTTTEVAITSSVSGTVESISPKEGSRIRSGQLVATLSDSTLSSERESGELSIKSSELELKAAEAALANCTIKSPVDGVVLTKNAKVGDNVNAGDTEKPMMIIADMNSMKFYVDIDEMDIWNMEKGQVAVVNADAIADETFAGEVTNIANEGTPLGDGVTVFKVEVTIDKPGNLKSGMNVNAKVVLESATNVLTVPEAALLEADGKNALLIVKNRLADPSDLNNPLPTVTPSGEIMSNEEMYPWIKVPKGCSLVKVKYGISDGTNVEIISGLKEGDIVAYTAGNVVGAVPKSAETPAPVIDNIPNGNKETSPAVTEPPSENENSSDGVINLDHDSNSSGSGRKVIKKTY